MADQQLSMMAVVKKMSTCDWADDFAVAWYDEDDEVICIKAAAGAGDAIDTRDLSEFMAQCGMLMGYNVPDSREMQFKRMDW